MVMEFVVEVWETNFQLSFITILHNFIKTDFICYYTVHLMNLLAYNTYYVDVLKGALRLLSAPMVWTLVHYYDYSFNMNLWISFTRLKWNRIFSA